MPKNNLTRVDRINIKKTKGDLPKGVYRNREKFTSRLNIKHNGKVINIHIGTYDTVREAYEQRKKWIESLI